MNDIDLVTKTCTKCGETQSATEFYGGHAWCKSCDREDVRNRNARRRAEMGDERWLAHRRETVAASRARTGNVTGNGYNQARRRAAEALIRRHQREFEHLFLLARRGELPHTTDGR